MAATEILLLRHAEKPGVRRDGPGGAWRFTQHCQGLLAGDPHRPFDFPDACSE